MSTKILNIIPAEGWHAKYRRDNGGTETSRLVCFALVEERDSRGIVSTAVRAMDADSTGLVEWCDQAKNFIGLAHVNDQDFGRYDGQPAI